jgi:hypothetical protein
MEKKTETIKTGLTFHLYFVNKLESLVEFFKKLLTSSLLGFCNKWLEIIGHIGIIVAAALGFLFTLVFAIRTNEFDAFLYGIAWVLIIFVAQYTAHKFLPKGDELIKNNPTQLSSRTFLDCFGFLVLIGGVVMLVLGIVSAIKFRALSPFFEGLAQFVLMEFVALISFNPKEVEIGTEKDNTAGQEAIGIATFFIKAFIRLVPIFFGIGIVLGTVLLLISFFGLFGANPGWAFPKGMVYAQQILSASLLPFISYLIFVIFYLAIDIIRAILSIPGKLGK